MVVPSWDRSERTVSSSVACWSYRKADGSSMIVLLFSFSCSPVESVLHFLFKCKITGYQDSTTFRRLSSYSTKGDASVPTPLYTTPAPTRPGRLAPDM